MAPKPQKGIRVSWCPSAPRSLFRTLSMERFRDWQKALRFHLIQFCLTFKGEQGFAKFLVNSLRKFESRLFKLLSAAKEVK